MIGDPTGAITRNFGVMIEEAGLALRGTFVIDPEGQIKICRDQRRRHRPRRQGTAAQGQGRPVRRRHPGEVCPAKWKEGEKTLAPSLDLVGKI
jgi:peroxiredoxin (alkyl hydroperoxide reductase subunit C)